MGCKGSKSCDIIVQFEGGTKQLTGKLPTFEDLYQWIYDQFPRLRFHAIVLKINSIPLKSSIEYAYITRSADTIKILVEKVASNITTALGIAKICSNSGKIISTAILIKKDYLLLPKSCMNSLSEILIMFHNGVERLVDTKEQPIEVSNYFIAVKLDKEVVECEAISLYPVQLLENEISSIFYFTNKNPVLQKYSGKFKSSNQDEIQVDVLLGEGAEGSPILNKNNELLGVYLTNNFAASASFLNNCLNSKSETLVKKITSSFSTPEILFDSFPNTSCYLDSFKNQLIYYCPEEMINKVVPAVDSLPGSSAVACCYGIVITGFNYDKLEEVKIFDGVTLRNLPSLSQPHSQHCSVCVENEIYVISGNTTAVEVFNFKTNRWITVSGLSKKRAMATATTINSAVYVIGGRRDEKVLKSIVMYKNSLWKKINLELPVGLMLVGCLAFQDTLLIFGGETNNGKNKNSWSLQFEDNALKNESLNIVYNFGRFPVCYYDDEVLFYTNDGMLLRYHHVTNKILTMSLDQENFTFL